MADRQETKNVQQAGGQDVRGHNQVGRISRHNNETSGLYSRTDAGFVGSTP